MKKFFAVLGCILGFALICVIAYFMPGRPEDIELETGKYVLIKIVEEKDGEEITEEFDINDENLNYIQVYKDKKLQSFSTKGLLQDGNIYTYKITGTALKLYLNDKKVHDNFYAENTIIIYAEEVENDEIVFKGNYYFTLKK